MKTTLQAGSATPVLSASVLFGQTFTGLNDEPSPTDLTASLLPETKADGRTVWAWDAVGPGAGLSTTSGQLIIPAQHRNIISTDHGRSWHLQKLSEATSAGSPGRTRTAGTRRSRPTAPCPTSRARRPCCSTTTTPRHGRSS
ncbi:sialidase family protein [Actinomadura rubrisoli]|uniref:Exo-alpha-sialidase n=1 Tax=Actinomadura rubrisoli TaxID=2530368 RepID=A0A4V6PF40_9ACTN|nr:sialidase family protein [Actinomadura rubrisoli]TDD91007.1 exo-alpha-sialidase [Actinomadura rubrisoli]